MTTPRLYLPQFLQKDTTCMLNGADLKYLKSVLRMKVGERVFLFDGRGHESTGIIKHYTSHGATVKIIETNSMQPDAIEITLFQSLAKAGVMDFIIEKATELGVARIVPFVSVRSVAKIPKDKISAKCVRWQKIAREAARKCGRADIPEIEGILTLDESLNIPSKDDIKLIFWEEEKKTTVKQIFRDKKVRQAKAFSIIIGPEGGFTVEEVACAREKGFVPVSLGDRVLKVDTALMSALTVIQYEKGIFSGDPEGGPNH
ncbi:MAG: 16S rRNA (uracil(1498)-N(3))-methyltransferase [Deltaproteobacteria bacterium]|nr:16S rRNA (uracil(1498)-N(3))-methyltransferase [Deltaproteobacteria bacterium]